MSDGVFLIVLTGGAGALAMWIHARFPSLAPERLGRSIVHVAVAYVLLKLTARMGESTGAFVTVVVFVLPALVYALLSAIWLLRNAQAALGLSR